MYKKSTLIFFYKRFLTIKALALACALIAMESQAQTTADLQRATDAQRQAQERDQQRQQQLQPVPDVRLSPDVPSPDTRRLPTNEQPCFRIDSVSFTGSEGTPIQFDSLRQGLEGPGADDGPVGRCLGAQGVGQLIGRAQDALIAQGFVTSRVLAPPQDLSGGALALQVLPGRIQRIRLTQPDDRASLRPALPMREGDVLQLRDMEQALENLKRVPTVEADIQIEPGQEPGTSDLVVGWSQSKPWRIALTADDSGAPSSGQYQGSATFSYDHALTLNDLFYVTASSDLGGGDPGLRGTLGKTTHYSVPFGYWLVSLNSSRNRYFQTVAGATQDYVYSGHSRQQDIKLTHLFFRDASSKTSWSVKAFARQSENFIDDTEVEVQRRRVGGYELGLQHKTQLGAVQVEGNTAFKKGTKAFGANQAPEDLFGEGTHQFELVTAEAQVQTPFNVGVQGWYYQGNWRWQNNRSRLTPQDQFGIGGRYTVRGFDGQSSLSAERGWLFRNEVSTALGDSDQRLYFALDHGRVKGPSAQNLLGHQLTGFAMGLRGKRDLLSFDLFVGAPVRKPTGFRSANTTYGFSLAASF
jgi:hemolysin activation/secretion protein